MMIKSKIKYKRRMMCACVCTYFTLCLHVSSSFFHLVYTAYSIHMASSFPLAPAFLSILFSRSLFSFLTLILPLLVSSLLHSLTHPFLILAKYIPGDLVDNTFNNFYLWQKSKAKQRHELKFRTNTELSKMFVI